MAQTAERRAVATKSIVSARSPQCASSCATNAFFALRSLSRAIFGSPIEEHEMADLDLVRLWEAHCRCEFETRDVDATMATMVAEPYVNHIPTMTGGVGHDQLKRFYKYHFIGVNPPDFRLTPISRTVGTDSLVDEFIVHFLP